MGTTLTAGKNPVAVKSMTTTVELLRSFDVPAATLVSCICPLVGVVNCVTVSVTEAKEAYVPAVSNTVNSELVNRATHVPDDGTVTVQAFAESTAIPAPESVMAVPALPDEVEIA